jgi:hypothetical protein
MLKENPPKDDKKDKDKKGQRQKIRRKTKIKTNKDKRKGRQRAMIRTRIKREARMINKDQEKPKPTEWNSNNEKIFGCREQ